jgi:hypothetical protein
MDAKELIELITKDVRAVVEEKGLTSIVSTNLLQYFDQLRTHIDSLGDVNASKMLAPTELERYKAELSLWRETQVALFNAAILTGQNALKSLMLINGGAVVALLAFIGNASRSTTGSVLAKTLSLSLIWFGGGVLSAALASAATYLCQFCYGICGNSRGKSFKIAVWFHALAIVFALAALAAFGCGTWNVYLEFSRLSP